MAAPQNRESPWNNDQLGEDVATINYEQALRAHARVRPGTADAEADSLVPCGSHRDTALHHRPLKTASITIRLSDTECAQLRARATEAGLTISSYLRSCTLEVECLRAQVKEALAELRNSTPHPAIPESKTESMSGFSRVLYWIWNRFRLIRSRPRPAIRLNPSNPFAPARY